MKDKICPKCNNTIKWDGLGWTCDNCGEVIEPTFKEVRQAVSEAITPEQAKKLLNIERVENWNSNYNIGQQIFVKKDNGHKMISKTRSKAWLLSDGTPVIKIKGIRGCYALERIIARSVMIRTVH